MSTSPWRGSFWMDKSQQLQVKSVLWLIVNLKGGFSFFVVVVLFFLKRSIPKRRVLIHCPRHTGTQSRCKGYDLIRLQLYELIWEVPSTNSNRAGYDSSLVEAWIASWLMLLSTCWRSGLVSKALHTTWVLARLITDATALCVKVEREREGESESIMMALWGLDLLSCLEKLKKNQTNILS